MANFDFTLKSGSKMHISTAPFELAIALLEAVKMVSRGQDPSLDIGDVVLTSPEVRKALYPVLEYSTYDSVRITPSLFDDPKIGDRARADYFEIGSNAIDVNCKPFFLKISSTSNGMPPQRTENPA